VDSRCAIAIVVRPTSTCSSASCTSRSLVVSSAEVTLSTSAAGAEISGIDITLRAAVPGLDAARFAELASTAERTCPVSKALAATKITLDAALA